MQLQLHPNFTRRVSRVGSTTTPPRVASPSRLVVKAAFTQYGTKPAAVNGQRLTKDALVKDPDLAEV